MNRLNGNPLRRVTIGLSVMSASARETQLSPVPASGTGFQNFRFRRNYAGGRRTRVPFKVTPRRQVRRQRAVEVSCIVKRLAVV